MNRLLKRFRREHRPKAREWVFHKVTWGDVEVSVMPRSIKGQVIDSNTGIVMAAPFHGALRGRVVVQDGRRPNCDIQALNMHITGDRNVDWRKTGEHPYCLPCRRMREEDKNEAYQQAVSAIMTRGCTREQAEWQADQVLGWCSDSLSCAGCKILIPGVGGQEIIERARGFGWRTIIPMRSDGWYCIDCSTPETQEMPPLVDLVREFPEDFRMVN